MVMAVRMNGKCMGFSVVLVERAIGEEWYHEARV
jgi:hypothetical protein